MENHKRSSGTKKTRNKTKNWHDQDCKEVRKHSNEERSRCLNSKKKTTGQKESTK